MVLGVNHRKHDLTGTTDLPSYRNGSEWRPLQVGCLGDIIFLSRFVYAA